MASSNINESDVNPCEKVEYVRIVSADDHEFIIEKEIAYLSQVLQYMMEGPFEYDEYEMKEVHLKQFDSLIVSKICLYLQYKARFMNSISSDIPDFQIEPEIAMELLIAASFLQI